MIINVIGKQGRLLSESNLQVTASQINRTFAENYPLKRLMRHWTRTPRIAILAFLFLLTEVTAQIPPGYYDPANGKTGADLQSALHNIISGHTVIAYSALWNSFYTTDDKPNGTVWDIYSDIPDGTANGNPPYSYSFGTDQCGNYSAEGDCYNREHSWPKSWFNDGTPMNSDLFHIYPTDGKVNGMRDNFPYGTVGVATWTSLNGSKLGSCDWPGYTGTVFEPREEYKGDLARTCFYMSTRYYNEDAGWTGSPSTTGSQLKPWALQLMLHWNSVDPVSPKETGRNNTVYSMQHNRNPFIDHPEYAYLIWGNPVSVANQPQDDNQLQIVPNPATDAVTLILPSTTETEPLRLYLISTTGTRIPATCTRSGNTLIADIRTVPAGIYMVEIRGNVALFHAKLVKR